MARHGGLQRLSTTPPASPTRPTTSRRRPRSRAPASTSACCRSSASAAAWIGACTPTTRPGTNGIDPRNGGIVGTVSYDTTRNELDPQLRRRRGLAARRLRPAPSSCTRRSRAAPTQARPATPTGAATSSTPDGSYAKGKLLNTYVTETWERPTGCMARDVDGNPLVHGVDEQRAGRPTSETTATCTRRPPAGRPVRPLPDRPGHAGRQLRRGGGRQLRLRRRLLRPARLDADRPGQPRAPAARFDAAAGRRLPGPGRRSPTTSCGSPLYKVTREEDINIGNGDQFIPQVPPPACAGPLHTVDVARRRHRQLPGDRRSRRVGNGVPVGVTVPASTPVDNPTFLDIGGSPYEGMPKPLCDTKLVHARTTASRSCPIFNVFTDVPDPGPLLRPDRRRPQLLDRPQLDCCTARRPASPSPRSASTTSPTGLVTTVESDFNGVYDVLLPSTNHINCPTPSGVCANMYRFVANDPGIPGRLNPNYNPQYRTIATEFEAFPGLIIPTDSRADPGGRDRPAARRPDDQVRACALDAGARRSSFAVLDAVRTSRRDRRRHASRSTAGLRRHQGHRPGHAGRRRRSPPDLVERHPDRRDRAVPTTNLGPHQLKITATNGQTHGQRPDLPRRRQRAAYNPHLYEVAEQPELRAQTPDVVHAGRDAARHGQPRDPGRASTPRRPAARPRRRLPGPARPRQPAPEPARRVLREPDHRPRRSSCRASARAASRAPRFVPGSIIDGGAFGGDSPVATAWYTKIGALTWDGNQDRQRRRGDLRSACRAPAATPSRPRFNASFTARHRRLRHPRRRPAGLPRQHQRDRRRADRPARAAIVTQGGAIFANAYARYLQITNNVVQNNGGALRDHPHRHARPAGAGHQQPQRRRPHRQQPHHRQRRHQPGGRHRPLRRRRQLRGGQQRHLRQLLGRVRRRHEPSTASARTARSTTTASTSTSRTTKAAAS